MEFGVNTKFVLGLPYDIQRVFKQPKNHLRSVTSERPLELAYCAPPLPPSKLYKKSGILGQQIFCTVLRGGPPSKVYKTPSKGGP